MSQSNLEKGFDQGLSNTRKNGNRYVHALAEITERLITETSLATALERTLSIILSAAPAKLALIARLNLDSGKTEFSYRTGGPKTEFSWSVFSHVLENALDRNRVKGKASDGPPEKCLYFQESGNAFGTEFFGVEIDQVILAVLNADDSRVDVLLLGDASPELPSGDRKAFLCSALNLVRLTSDRLDITQQRHQFHDQVFGAKREWQASVDVLAELVCLVDADGEVIRANRTWEEFDLGRVKDAPGTKFKDLLERLGIMDDALYSFFKENPGQVGSLLTSRGFWKDWRNWFSLDAFRKLPFSTPGGRLLSLQLTMCNAAGEPSINPSQDFCVVVVADVTEREQAKRLVKSYNEDLQRQVENKTRALQRTNEELKTEIAAHNKNRKALELSEKKYLTFAENTLIGIYLVEQGRISYCNSRLSGMLGYTVEETIGLSLETLFGSDFLLRLPVAPAFDTGTGKVVEGFEFAVPKKDGSRIWIKVHQAQFAHGRNEIIIGNVDDVTARKEYEQRLMVERQRTRELSEKLLEAQEQERRRVARDLHDSVGQRLSVIRLRLDQYEQSCSTAGQSPQRERFSEIGRQMKEAIDEVRRVSMDLRPSLLDDLGIQATLSWFHRELKQAAPHIEVESEIAIEGLELESMRETQIFRIIQEACNNILKYADASKIKLRLGRRRKYLELWIRDNGNGFSSGDDTEYKGVGLGSMRERAELSGGDLFVCSRDGAGVSIRAIWPLN